MTASLLTLLSPPGHDEPSGEVFLRITGVVACGFALLGAVFGFVRGLAYLPTLWAAVPEGAILFGFAGLVPAALIGGCVAIGHRLHRRA